jgi:hypothetical protein
MSGFRPPELDIPTDPPSNMLWVARVFQELNTGRQFANGIYPQRISHQEIQAWCNLTGERLQKRDLAVIRVLDVNWINTRNALTQEISNGR